jgi:dolichol-phosphate mannosyltransferase
MPTYNEAKSLPRTVSGLFKHNPDVSLLVIDDNSPDGTGSLAEQLAADDPRISVMHRSEKGGLGKAYLAGFDWGLLRNFDYIVEMDADGSHRPRDLPNLLVAAQHADLVIGSRWVNGGSVENWPRHRQFISRAGNFYARTVLGCKVKDLTAGFRVFHASLLKKLPTAEIRAQGYGFQVEMAWRSIQSGAVVAEVPIVFVERAEGESKMSTKIVIEALLLTTWWGIESLFRIRSLKKRFARSD